MKFSNSEHLSTLGTAVLSLILSGVIAVFLIFLCAMVKIPDGANRAYSKPINTSSMKTVMGTTELIGDTLEVIALKPYENDQRAIVVSRTTFNSDNYPYAEYEIQGRHPGIEINLIWRTAQNPRSMARMPLHWNPDKASILNLAGHAAWNGEIIEIGLYMIGELREKPIAISPLTLQPHGWQSMLASIWSEWTAFRGWSGRSINFLLGTPGPLGTETLSPTVAVATWAGLALLIKVCIGRLRRKLRLPSCVAVVLVPWIALDLFWQRELSTQLEETRFLFSGKDMHEKHLADKNAHIYSHVKHLKDEILPDTKRNRIFLLENEKRQTYARIKTLYYLLPNNVFSYGSTPPTNGVRPGDYVLLLGESPDLSFLPAESLLTWGEGNKLQAKLINSDQQGKLYELITEIALNEKTNRNEDG
jgi:hypothetical protein